MGISTVALDDQMVPGATYTFQFKCANYFCLSDASDRFRNEIVTYGPVYAASVQVTSPFTTNLYDVQFTYDSDGSDVVSDVSNELITAAQQGGDSFTFVGAIMATAAEVTVGVTQAAGAIGTGISNIGSGIGKTVGNTVGGIVGGLTSNAGFDAILIVIALVVIGYFLLISGAGPALARRS